MSSRTAPESWSGLLEQLIKRWRKSTRRMIADTVHIAQRSTEEAMRLMAESAQWNLELLQKNIEAERLVLSVFPPDSECEQAVRQVQVYLGMQEVLGSVLRQSLECSSVEQFLDSVLDQVLALPWIDSSSQAVIFLMEEERNRLTMASQRRLTPVQVARCARVELGVCLCGMAAARCEVVFAEALDAGHAIRYPGMHPHGHYCIPMLSGGRLYGVLSLSVPEGRPRDRQQEEFLRLVAGILAGAIARHRVEKTVRDTRLKLIAAQEIQERFLPGSAPELSAFDIAAELRPAEYTAGDYFDYLRMPAGAVGVLIGDVSGQGFDSALLTASVHAYLRVLAETEGEIDRILQRVNRILVEDVAEDRFVTLVFTRLEPDSRTLTYVNAGHPPGYVLDATGQLRQQLLSTTLPLAAFPDTAFAISGRIVLQPGETVVLVTDGVLDAQDARGERFGEPRLLETARTHLGCSAAEIVQALHDAVQAFSNRKTPVDDLTIVVVKVR